jgi:hypothetical protein
MADFSDFGLLVSRYSASLPTLVDTQLQELQVDINGRLIISGRWLEDAPHVSGDAGLLSLGVRDDGVQASATVGPNVFTAVNFGPGGNSISLVFDGVASVSTVVAAWNAANTNNQVSFTGSGATVPTAQTITLIGGADQSVRTSDNLDYSAFSVDKFGRLKVAADVSVDPSAAEFNEDAPNNSGDTGLHVLTVRQDTLAISTSADGDYADFKVNAKGELYVIDKDANASLDAIEASTASIDTKLTTTNSTLSSIDTSLNNIETAIVGAVHDEDSAHVSGDKGMLPLAVRNDAGGSMVSADGDYAPFQVNAAGELRVTATLSPIGSEQYSVTDALAAGGDGLITITAAATPFVTVASFAHTSGIAYVFGYQFACDQNADAQLITDDGTDIIVYKRSLNSSAMPSVSEHFSNEGRIEIPGSAGLQVKLQIKKRSSAGGNSLASGSIHIRK